MIVSLVRSNEARSTGALLTDFRRINVALTRARTKLVLVGNSDTLKGVPTMHEAFVAVQQHGRVVQLQAAPVCRDMQA